jgi:hypothetical protein
MPSNGDKRSASESTPSLFSQETMDALTDGERRGEYTLERVRQLRPELIDEVIKLRGQFIGQLRIAKILGVHHRTIAAIDLAYPERIEAERKSRAAMLRATADTLVELVADNPESVPANVRCLAASQLYDKAQLLDGAPTANIAIATRHIDSSAPFKTFIQLTEEIEALHKAGAIDIAKVKELGWSALTALENEVYSPVAVRSSETDLEPEKSL